MTNSNTPATIGDVLSYWDRRPCNIRHSTREVGTREYFDEVEARLSDPAVLANQEPAELRLRLIDVRIYDQPAAGIRVFFDSPDAANEPYDAEPGYVESFAFFPSPTGTATGESVGSFLIDLDGAVAKLVEAALLPLQGHKLTIIPIDAEGNPSGRVAVGSLELEGG